MPYLNDREIKEMAKEHAADIDREWFQIIESIFDFHPVSMTDALNTGIEKMKNIKKILSSLPKTKDNKPVSEGMEVFVIENNCIISGQVSIGCDNCDEPVWHVVYESLIKNKNMSKEYRSASKYIHESFSTFEIARASLKNC